MLTKMVSISWPRDPPASASQSAGITGVSHRAWQLINCFLHALMPHIWKLRLQTGRICGKIALPGLSIWKLHSSLTIKLLILLSNYLALQRPICSCSTHGGFSLGKSPWHKGLLHTHLSLFSTGASKVVFSPETTWIVYIIPRRLSYHWGGIKKIIITSGPAQWVMPVIPAIWEAEVGESLEPERWRLQWAKITPLHSSLGDRARPYLKNKIK